MKKQPSFLIIYEDERILGVNKASGIAVGGDRWDDSKDRLDRLLYRNHIQAGGEPTDKNKQPFLPGQLFTVHRIDQDTSGLVVFAKDRETHRQLSKAFEGRLVKKRYLAVIHGRPAWKETLCDLPLVPDGDKQHRTIIDKYRGKASLTRFRFLGGAGNYGVVEAMPETGRTHQIRVHLTCLGHPVVCDPLYGTIKPLLLSSFKRGWRGDPLEERPLLSRLGLHAQGLILPDYRAHEQAAGTGEALNLQAPFPRDLRVLLKQMEKSAGEFPGVWT